MFPGVEGAASEGLSNSWEAEDRGFLELSKFPEAYEKPENNSAFLQLAFGWCLEPGGGLPLWDTSSLVVNPEAGRVFMLVWRREAFKPQLFLSLTAGHHKPTHLPSLQPAHQIKLCLL